MSQHREKGVSERTTKIMERAAAFGSSLRLGHVAIVSCLAFVASASPQMQELVPFSPTVKENFNPDMGSTFMQYSRADWVDCVEEPNGRAQVILDPAQNSKAVVGVVEEMVMGSTGADMPILADGATIERQGSDFKVTPMRGTPVVVKPDVGKEQLTMQLSCSDAPN